MSLINDVLKDLDSKPEHQDKSILGLMYSAPERTSPSSRKWPVLLLLILILAAAGGYFVYITLYEDAKPASFMAQPLKDKPLEAVVDTSVQPKTEAPQASKVEQVTAVKVNETNALSEEIAGNVQKVTPNRDASAVLTRESKTETIAPSTPSVKQSTKDVVQKEVLVAKQSVSEPKAVVASKPAPAQTKQAVSSAPVITQAKPSANTSVSTSAKAPAVQKVNTSPETAKDSEPTPVLSKSKTREVQLYEQALSAYQRGAYEESERLVDSLLATQARSTSTGLNTSQPKYQALKARLLLNRKPDLLVNYIDQNKVDIASSDELLALSATAYQRTKDHVRAVQAYDLLVQRQPTEGRWWLAMAFSLESLEALDKALKAYSLALQSGTLPANAREYAATKANQITKKIEA